jgi:CRISPR-associated endonuclease/helicase Cas3
MNDLYSRILNGTPPRMVDLPTGSGKTDLAVVWLIALAYYGANRSNTNPVPRRLIWVVNRKVLVGQIYRLAEMLQNEIGKNPAAESIKKGLAGLSTPADADEPLRIVQLRGQVIDDREWSFNPACPTLVIGTVDQIGSRLLFQGYGLGKRERPMHAGLFGVDAWICVDEAHLVPAFVLTMRQLRHQIAKQPNADCPAALRDLFSTLPWYFTELSATPGLPAPVESEILALSKDDETDAILMKRIAAGRSKRVVHRNCDEKNIISKIVERALDLQNEQKRVAIYIFRPGDARKIDNAITKALKDKKVRRTLCITGRMRGVEREALGKNAVFRALSTENRVRHAEALGRPAQTVYLIGTSAAEVGVDTDADIILCDFAAMDTLLQRLGRLDRLGLLTSMGLTPTMEIFGPKVEAKHMRTALEISNKLKGEPYDPSAGILVANHWVTGKDAKSEEIVLAATHHVLSRQPDPSQWRHDEVAPATVSPVVTQPLTEPVLAFWTATTSKPHPALPVHPWLYGFTRDEQTTPLLGVIFRLELDEVVRQSHNVEESEEVDDVAESAFDLKAREVEKLFNKYSPAKSEAHWMPLHLVKEWLRGMIEEGKHVVPPPPVVAYRDDREWRIMDNRTSEGQASDSDKMADTLRAEDFIILPTSCVLPKKISDELNAGTDEFQPTDDVADYAWGEAPGHANPWLRNTDGSPEIPNAIYKENDSFQIGAAGENKILRYFVRRSASDASKPMTLSDHQKAAGSFAKSVTEAVTASDNNWAGFYAALGLVHDSGKDDPLWQNPIGNPGKEPLAKFTKFVAPAAFQGYRHEWGSLHKRATMTAWQEVAKHFASEDQSFLEDLFFHLIGTHHGHLRPDLPPQPNIQPSKLVTEVHTAALRWHRLQSALGPWRLAYLEALLKAADTLASRDVAEPTSTQED